MDEQSYQLFENYLSNELSQEERRDFENQLKNDTDLKEKFDLYQETTQHLSHKFNSSTADFKQNLKKISKKHFSESNNKPKVITIKPWYYAVAASIVIVMGTFFMMSGTPEYGDFNQHEKAYFVERSTADENLNEAQKAFNNKEYKKAVASFEKVKDSLSPELQYFYAISLIETNEYVKAETLLNTIKSGNSVYKNKATWYLALSNLKQKNFEECKKYLNQIPADAEDYSKAKQLLKDLD